MSKWQAPSHLSINRTVCVDTLEELKNPVFRTLTQQVFARDDYACQICDFRCHHWQQVVTKNGLYRLEDFTESNMATVCPHCFLGQRIGHAALKDDMVFIYMPELSQAQVNNISRIAFYYDNLVTDSNIARQNIASVSVFWETLISRKEQTNEQFEHATLSSLKELTTFLFDLPEEQYCKRNAFFQNTRYLLKPSKMHLLNKTYANSVFKDFDGETEVERSATIKQMR